MSEELYKDSEVDEIVLVELEEMHRLLDELTQSRYSPKKAILFFSLGMILGFIPILISWLF